jgi:hypothetical protein
MKKEYMINIERGVGFHKFVHKYDNIYGFETKETWMPLYVTYEDSKNVNIKFIDVDGGPNIHVGWNNGEIMVEEIFNDGLFILFKLKEI